MALKQRFIKMLLALIAVCAFTACTNPADGTAGGNTGGGGTPSVPEYTVRFSAGEGGTITAKAGGQNIVSGSKVKKDTLVTFTAAPSGSTYTVGEWTIASPAVFKDGGEKGSLTAEVYVTEDITIGVQFEQVTPPPARQVRLTITGDERLVPHTCYIDTAKDTVWSAALKTQIEAKFALKTEWQGGDYGVYACKLGNGKTLTDGHTFAQDTVVYVVTNYTKFRINGTVLEGYTSGHEPRGRIIIPDGVTEIKEGAFQNCRNLTGTLIFPQSLQKIKNNIFNDKGAFKGCTGLTGLDFSACTELTEIGRYAFSDCTGFTGSLDLQACTQLTTIGESAFTSCSGFNGELKLPAALIEIETWAFYGCTGFTGSLDLQACTQLTKIGSYAFRECSGFNGELKLPAALTEIGFCAFLGCTGFTGSLDLSACTQLTTIGESAFTSCSGFNGELKLPAALIEIETWAFYGCTGFTGSLDLQACTQLTKIGNAAFFGCRDFSGELKLPASLIEIGKEAFSYCTGVTGSLDLQACTQLTKIENSAFSGCTGVTGSLDLQACTQLTTIGDDAFKDCRGFSGELPLPANLTEIGSGAFSGCTQAEIKLPQSITSVGICAFGNGSGSYCKKVKIPNGTQHDRIKTLVTQSFYPEKRIESY